MAKVSDLDLRHKLTQEQYRITQLSGTEPPCTGTTVSVVSSRF